jgi:hypothetical protein
MRVTVSPIALRNDDTQDESPDPSYLSLGCGVRLRLPTGGQDQQLERLTNRDVVDDDEY